MIQTRRVPLLLPLLLLSCSDSSPTDPGLPGPPTIDVEALSTCGQVSVAYEEELAFLQFCTRASDCGQPLERTGCGCSESLVARREVDPTRFYAILDRAETLECAVGIITPCDCPPVDGFLCVDSRCSWNYL